MLVTILYAAMLVGVVWVLLGQLPAGWDALMPLPYLIALTPFLWVPLVACAAGAALLHEWGLMGCLLVVALAASTRRIAYWGTDPHPGRRSRANAAHTHAATHGTLRETPRETDSANRGTPRETSSDATGTRPASLTLMTLNCRYGRADADAIAREVRARGVDVLALQEASDDLAARLDAAGVTALLPYRQSGEARQSDNGGYNMILSRIEPSAVETNAVDIPAADVPSITLTMADGRDVTLASAHPKSPMRGCRAWSAGILGLGALADRKRLGDRGEAVVLGDLNSATDHPSFRALLGRGLRDASLTQATGPNPTFPRWLAWPRIELDHILATRGLAFSHVEAFAIAHTDHLALIATIALD